MRQTVRAIVINQDKLLVMHRNKFGHEYYALIGGAIDAGETAEHALHRELAEESGIAVTNPRLVIIENAGEIYGTQYIYLCDYVSGEPALAADSEETKINTLGRNLYQPLWLSLSELADAKLLPVELKALLLAYLKTGFPDQPVTLTVPS